MSKQRLLLLELVVPLVLVICANVGFSRWVAATPMAPLPRALQSSIATGKYLAFLDRVRSGEPVDTIYTGLSQMMMLDPAVVDAELAAEGRASSGFNFSAPMHGPYLVTPLLQHIVDPLVSPRLVVHGLMPLDVILEPKGRSGRPARASTNPVYSIHEAGFRTRILEFLHTRVPLIQYREVIVDWLTDDLPEQRDSWNKLARASNRWGMLPMTHREGPVTEFRDYEDRYKEDFRRFGRSLKRTAVFDHAITLAHWCQQNGIDFVLVNTPVHPMFFDLLPRGRRDYARFVDELHRRADEAGIPLFDPLGTQPGRRDFFRDTHHPNSAGATWFAGELAAYLLEQGLPRSESEVRAVDADARRAP